MPTREEESGAAKREPKRKGVCPFCGRGDYLYKSQRQKGWWECANEKCRMYRKPFPSPSYGARGKPSWWDRLRGRD